MENKNIDIEKLLEKIQKLKEEVGLTHNKIIKEKSSGKVRG
jgi:hypothetical protein